MIREITFRKPMTLSILTERRVFAPYGLNGKFCFVSVHLLHLSLLKTIIMNLGSSHRKGCQTNSSKLAFFWDVSRARWDGLAKALHKKKSLNIGRERPSLQVLL